MLSTLRSDLQFSFLFTGRMNAGKTEKNKSYFHSIVLFFHHLPRFCFISFPLILFTSLNCLGMRVFVYSSFF